MERKAAPASPWRSLFLPLSTEEKVVFVSFISLLQRSEACPGPLNAFHVANDASTKREALLCVMENQRVVIFDLTSEDAGPRSIISFSAAKDMKRQSSLSLSDSESLAILSKVVASCASLIPMSLVLASRHEAVYAGGGSADECGVPLCPLQSPSRLFRGVMGSSNGRVDVFTETSFAFGFPAHNCPVVHAEALFVGESAAPQPVPDNGSSLTMNVLPNGQAQETFASVSQVLGFLTMGADGVVFVWRRRSEGFRREKLLEPSLLSKCHALHASLPYRSIPLQEQLERLGGGNAEADAVNQVQETRLYSPTSPSPTPRPATSGPCQRSTSVLPFKVAPSLIFSGGNGFSNSIKVRSCETMKEVEHDVELGGMLSRTTAITTEGSMCLVAREKVVHSVNYTTRTCKRVLTATSCVLHLALENLIGVAGCESGKLYVFHADQGTVLGVHYTYTTGPVKSLSFVFSAMLLAVVDSQSLCVELFELPESYLRQSTRGTAATSRMLNYYDAQSCAAADVIKKCVELQECSTGAGSAAVARTFAAEEQLLLSRYLIPEEVVSYLSRQHRLL